MFPMFELLSSRGHVKGVVRCESAQRRCSAPDVRWCLQFNKPANLPFTMTSRGKAQSAAALLILVTSVFIGNALTCHPAEYQIGTECCPRCPIGSCVKTDCTEFRNTSCLPCMDGTFMNQSTGRTQCFSCTSCNPGSGLKVKASCTPTSDTVCEPLEGFYCLDSTDNRCVSAQKHTRCRPGQYISEKGTASTDTVCSDCTDGTFSDGTFTSCQPHTQCESQNLQLIRPGSASSDSECGEKSSNVPTIVGVSVFFLLIVSFLLGVFIFWRKKKCLPVLQWNTKPPTEEINTTREENGEMLPAAAV